MIPLSTKNVRLNGVFTGFLIAILGLASGARAELRLGAPFTDHLVVQHDRPVVVWGWDDAGREIEVQLDGKTATTSAGPDGRWEVKIDPPKAGGPYRLSVVGSETITLEDVLSGEVWLASGQSNMEWTVAKSEGATEMIADATNSQIRFLLVPKTAAEEPEDRVDARWEVVSPATVPEFSAVAYLFAQRLQAELGRPVGILQAAWGGSKIQAWMPPDALDAHPGANELRKDYRDAVALQEGRVANWEANGRPGKKPTVSASATQRGLSILDNGMMHPLQPYAIRGAIWYQGEADADNGEEYRKLFALLVGSWRDRFRNPNLPVYFAQLPNFELHQMAKEHWADFRHHQSLIPSEVPHTAYAVLIDAGDPQSIHPTDKRAPADRLAQLALVNEYGRDGVAGGPIPVAIERRNETEVAIRFENAGGGLELETTPGESSFVLRRADGSIAACQPTKGRWRCLDF